MGVRYKSLGALFVTGGRPGRWEILLDQTEGKSLAAFALQTNVIDHSETGKPCIIPTILPAEEVFTGNHTYETQSKLRPHKLTLKALVDMATYRRTRSHLKGETLPDAIARTVTPLFYAGAVSLPEFFDNACEPPQSLLALLPNLQVFAESAKANRRSWQRGYDLDTMLKELVEALTTAFQTSQHGYL